MKKILCILSFLVFLLGSVNAQNVGGGLSLAGIASQIDGDQWGGYKKIGYHIGGWAYYDFSDAIALQVEILHSHRGSREVVKDFGQISLNYLDFPVLLRVRPLRNLNREVWAEFGPSIHYMLSARTGFNQNKLDQSENYSRVSAEGLIGAGAYLSDHVSVFGRWNIGITNLSVFYPPWFTIHYFSFGVKFGFK